MSSQSESVGRGIPRPFGIPVALWGPASCWILFALISFYFAKDTLGRSPGGPAADRVASQLGPETVAAPPTLASAAAIATVVGVALLGLTVLLLAGRSWARFALVGTGVVALIVLAWGARWEAYAALVLVPLGTVALMLPAVHRHLERP